MPHTDRLAAVVPLLCSWYEANRKPMPWREDPSPYHVWLSEIMLQQTRIEAAIPYYHRFLAELPTVEALAQVSDERLMKLWQGLGYYSRARNLKKTAVIICDTYGGRLPKEAKALRALPGIGDYTAGAIASIAYHQTEPAEDGNVLRVIMRLTACSDDILQPATRKWVTDALRTVYPAGREAALLTEGLMELGETVCIPNGEPRCESCPVREHCLAHQTGCTADLPVRIVKTKRRIEDKTLFLLSCDDRYAIVKRPDTGLLASMWEFPNREGVLTTEEVMTCVDKMGGHVEAIEPCGNAKHVFSHVEWHMSGFHVTCTEPFGPFTWATSTEILTDYAIPTTFRFYTALLEK